MPELNVHFETPLPTPPNIVGSRTESLRNIRIQAIEFKNQEP